MQLGCPTEDGNDKPLTVDALKEEILLNSGEDTVLIFPEAKRLTTSIRYWLEDAIAQGVRVVCFAVANPGKDIFLEMLEIELELPSDRPSLFGNLSSQWWGHNSESLSKSRFKRWHCTGV